MKENRATDEVSRRKGMACVHQTPTFCILSLSSAVCVSPLEV